MMCKFISGNLHRSSNASLPRRLTAAIIRTLNDAPAHPSRSRAPLRRPAAPRPRRARGGGRRAHRAHRPQRHRQVVAPQRPHRHGRARRRRAEEDGRPEDRAGRAGTGGAGELRRRGAQARQVSAPVQGRDQGRDVGRRAQARRARARLCAGARPAAARRADQPPRHRRHRAAGEHPAENAGGDRRHPRPRLPRPRHHAHRRARPRAAAFVRREFLGLREDQGGAARRRGGDAAQVRQVLGAGRGVDPQGHRGAAHAQRGPRAAPGAAARGARRRAASASAT